MRAFLRLAVVLLSVTSAVAADDVPDELKPWVPWVLHGHRGELCPLGEGGAPRCAWPGRLQLTLDDTGGRMTQSWDVRGDAAVVSLPGDAEHVPLDVTVDGRPAAVNVANGVPMLRLSPGTHVIAASWEWPALPESLTVPSDTGLVGLTLRGKEVAIPQRDDLGRLWLAARATEAKEEDSLQLAVHRLISDDVPLQVTTRLLFEVAGAAREMVLGPALPGGAIPVSIDSPLPARLESDGRLRVQVRPGSWTIVIVSRQPGPVTELSPPKAEPWAPDEVWSFAPNPSLRVVTPEGLSMLDPSQTAIPAEWRGFPTFKAAAGETLRLIETRRGDAEPAADELTVQRTLWLDFDGKGMTARDHLGGTLHRSWRLQMRGPFALSAVQVANDKRLLTRLAPGGPVGFEIREGRVNADADSRLDGSLRTIPAGGWDADLESLSGVLNLPPGWRLLTARGVDRAGGSWLDSWTLLDLFLALIVAAAAARIWGKGIGALALAVMVLTIPENGSLHWSWLVLLSLAGIEKLLAEGGRARRVIAAARLATAGVLAIMAIPFAVQQARQALHPQLENPWSGGGGGIAWGNAKLSGDMDREAGVSHEVGLPDAPPMEASADSSLERMAASNAAPMRKEKKIVSQREVHDPRDIIQVGSGVPGWTWRRHDLSWSGPVTRDQQLTLVLLPPAGMRLLSALTLALLAALLVRGLLPPQIAMGSLLRRLRSGSAPAVAALVLAMLHAAPARAETPSQEMLDELRRRVLERAACEAEGACVSMPRLFLEASNDTLRFRLKVVALADATVGLPGSSSQWTPQQVLVDGRPANAILRDNDALWLLVSEGAHDVELAGPLPERDTIGITLPTRPAHAEARADGWIVAGITNGSPAQTLQLSRLRKSSDAARKDGSIASSALPPFVRVSRRIQLGLRWQASTMVSMAAPTGSPVVLEIPLMPGESVTTAGIQVKDGKVLVNLAPGSPPVTWESTLAETASLQLTAPETTAWSEDWMLETSSRWHAEWTGIPPVHALETPGVRIPEWRPWAGESVTLALSRPEAVPGSSLAITSSKLDLTPGLRAQGAALIITTDSSRGGDQTITLPEGATVQAVNIDGRAQPVRQEANRVTLPVAPGAHVATIVWRDSAGMRSRYATPRVDLGLPSVNPAIELTMPQDRWVLWLSGPVLGPAVLFWPLLVVLVLLGLGLSRVRDVPLKAHDWVLLLVGLSQVPAIFGAAVVMWLMVLAWRRDRAPHAPAAVFALAQVLVVVGALISVGVLFAAINQGLLGTPDMQIEGNGSSSGLLRWTGDRAPGMLPQASVLSVPLLVYRLAMLLWALWLAAALVRWMRWAWDCFTTGGAWRNPFPRRSPKKPAAPPAAPSPAPAPAPTTETT